jgi:alkylhydroperoxidase/carboxymuconolactone decarboxylase family protein YurZ
MENYLSVAKEEGITDDEIGAAQSIVAAVAAGRVIAQFRDATKDL